MTSLYGSRARLRRTFCTLAVILGFAATAWGQAADSSKPAAAGPSPSQRGIALLQQAGNLILSEPTPGHCHILDLEASGGIQGQKPMSAQLRFVRGTQGKFALKCKLPMLGDAWVGQGAAPRMVAGGKNILLGSKNPITNHSPLGFADAEHLTKIQMATGFIGLLALMPDQVTKLVTIENEQGGKGLRFAAKKDIAANVVVSFQDDRSTPSQAVLTVTNPKLSIDGKAVIHQWQLNAAAQDASFDPPGGMPTHEVEQADLYHVFSALFDLAMERAE